MTSVAMAYSLWCNLVTTMVLETPNAFLYYYLPGLAQAWTVPCNSTFSYGIIVGSQTFTLDEGDLVLPQPDGSCVSGIEAWLDSTETTYVFGARFLSTIYL